MTWDTPLLDQLSHSSEIDGINKCYSEQPKLKHGEAKSVKCQGTGFGGYDQIKWTYQAKADKKAEDERKKAIKEAADAKAAADGTVGDTEIIAIFEMVMMVRGVTIYATRVRATADASDREQRGHG